MPKCLKSEISFLSDRNCLIQIEDRNLKNTVWNALGKFNFKSNVQFHSSGRVRPQQGTEICNFGAPSPLDSFNFLQWLFCFTSTGRFSL